MIARLLTSLCLALGALAVSAAAAGPALADCIGPTINYEAGEVAFGGSITVTGEGFGDECYDTGPPPEGQGVLGNPLENIEVFFQQGATEIVVAQGAANADYEFEVAVTVPAGLEPGEATIEARQELYGPAYNGSGGRLTVTDDPAPNSASGPVEPVTFGPDQSQQSPESTPETTTETASEAPTESAVETGSEDSEGSESGNGLLVGGVFVVLLLGAALIFLLPRIRARHQTS